MTGPSELEAMAGVNTTNDALRRALTGAGSILDALIDKFANSPLKLLTPQVTLVPHKAGAPIVHALHHLCHEAGTEYAAIAYDGIYAIATQSFWHLHPEELLVLQMILQSVPECSTLAQIPVHLPHTSSEKSWYLMLASLTAGCRLVLLTDNDISVAQLQVLVLAAFRTLKPQLLKASKAAVSRNLHSLQAFVLRQQHPNCVMVSSCHQLPSLTQFLSDGRDNSDDQSMQHQAMNTLSVFAASLADQMHVGTPPQTDAEQQEITEAFAEISGFRLAAVSDQHGKSRRTVFAVFIQELSELSERELAQQLLTLLKHLPLIGTAH
ncbi:MAG: hypothetical protein FRX49_00981 [Trebouxia sp. A1-2]|nr:MAG: hypothetical protein FRX49_00981 [Trebouxia sp. A1-2]